MKIPETSANVGAYYGSEENGQWQPNGVIIDSGVGGGVVGSGDAGIHRPVYPIHIPRGHVSGYVMAGGYYGGAGAGAAGYAQGPTPDDFADYMWMEHEEEFDKQVMQQLEEEALMEQCIEAMLEDEQRERHRPGHSHPTTSNGTCLSLEEAVSRSTLNPLAAEFVPTRKLTSNITVDKTEATVEPPTEPPSAPADDKPKIENDVTPAGESKTEEAPTLEPVEVSAAAADTQADRRSKKTDKRTPHKQEKKTKPTAHSSDTKIQPKKKEPVKPARSEPSVRPADDIAPTAEPCKPTQPTPPLQEEAPSVPKPINYAAAAKANKPKKAPTPPTAEKTLPAPTKAPTSDKTKPAKQDKPAAKEKPVQRKNSAK